MIIIAVIGLLFVSMYVHIVYYANVNFSEAIYGVYLEWGICFYTHLYSGFP